MFALTPEIEALQAAAKRLAEHELGPAARQAEQSGAWSEQALRVLDGLALTGLDLPAQLGGEGIGAEAKVVVLEALAQGDAGGLPSADPLGLAAGALAACPDAGLAREIVAACRRREAACALLVAADPEQAPLRIEWTPRAARWAFLSDGDRLSLLELRAQPEAVVALAFHASGGVAIDLRDARTLGTWELAAPGGLAVRGRARLWAAAAAIGVSQAALDATIAYTTERVVFGKAVAHHQANAFELAAAAARLQAARLLLHEAAAGFDAGARSAGAWATSAWSQAIETAVAVTDLGVQLLGGHGFLKDHLAEKRFREARMLGLLAGGRDAAEADAAAAALQARDPVFDLAEPAS